MEAEDLMKLYDSFWYEFEILKLAPTPSSKPASSDSNPQHQNQIQQDSPKLKLSRSHTRSMSDSIAESYQVDSLSPDSVLLVPKSKLRTILSGKEVTDPEIEVQKDLEDLRTEKKARKRKKKGESKSFSDLEFEELKGFMDLGFVFSEEDKGSSMASIIPGLQRLGKKEEEEEEEGEFEHVSEIPRPYLSEAWEFHERRRRRKEKDSLMKWRVPSLNNETDMKDNLRWWAHTVASTVR